MQFVLWRDVLQQHGKAPLHAMVGGGDQIYSDEVFSGTKVQEWLKKGREVSCGAVTLPCWCSKGLTVLVLVFEVWHSEG